MSTAGLTTEVGGEFESLGSIVLGPPPCLSSLCDRLGDMREVLDEVPVEVDEPYKRLDLCHIPWSWPVSNTSDLECIHLYMTFRKAEAKVLNCSLFKHALFCLEVEAMLLEDVRDPQNDHAALPYGFT